MAEKTATLLDSVNELLSKIYELHEKQVVIEKRILKVEQPYRIILDKTYIQGKTLVSIASEMNYSYEDICRKHRKALKLFESSQ